MNKLKAMLKIVGEEIVERWKNLRTVEGGLMIASGMVLYGVVKVAAFLGLDPLVVAKTVGATLMGAGVWKFWTKK